MRRHGMGRTGFTGLWVLGAASLLVACGGGHDGAPTAVITTAATEDVPLHAVVVVDGSESTDPEGAALGYSWSLAERPPGSTAEMADSAAKMANFAADLPGDYRVQLVVNDGRQDSEPAAVTIAVVRPAPTVTIGSPEDNQVFHSNTVAVTGTVDDPGAAIAVNGIPADNAAGSYAASLTLAEGAHRITVVATNAMGEGVAEVTAVINTGDNPVVWITSPRPSFIAGPALDAAPDHDAMPTQAVSVAGTVKVTTLFLIGLFDPNTPTVSINGQPATTVERRIFSLGCATSLLGFLQSQCYVFNGTVTASVGQALTITVDARDAQNRPGSAAVAGYVDYCIKGGSDGLARYQDDAGGRQNNRCHEIDGCSFYPEKYPEITRSFRNDPAAALGFPQLYNGASTEFGSGEAEFAKREFYIHGNRPQRPLPCNLHDQCYQTSGQLKGTCDFEKMLVGTYQVCARAYPFTCPYALTLEAYKCPKWALERIACYTAADLYYGGDVALGKSAFDGRQAEYTYSP